MSLCHKKINTNLSALWPAQNVVFIRTQSSELDSACHKTWEAAFWSELMTGNFIKLSFILRRPAMSVSLTAILGFSGTALFRVKREGSKKQKTSHLLNTQHLQLWVMHLMDVQLTELQQLRDTVMLILTRIFSNILLKLCHKKMKAVLKGKKWCVCRGVSVQSVTGQVYLITVDRVCV